MSQLLTLTGQDYLPALETNARGAELQVRSSPGFASFEGSAFPYRGQLCKATDQPAERAFRKDKNAHRPLAWGVLGLATDGLAFLLTHPVCFQEY